MKINQLFKSHIPEETVAKVIDCFGYRNFDDDHSFCKSDLIRYSTVEKMNAIKDEIGNHYLPCKARLYLDDLDENKCITILRQILRLQGLSLLSKQKYIKQKKCTIYSFHRIVSDELQPPLVLKIENNASTVISF
jgi:hypothetical protein